MTIFSSLPESVAGERDRAVLGNLTAESRGERLEIRNVESGIEFEFLGLWDIVEHEADIEIDQRAICYFRRELFDAERAVTASDIAISPDR